MVSPSFRRVGSWPALVREEAVRNIVPLANHLEGLVGEGPSSALMRDLRSRFPDII